METSSNYLFVNDFYLKCLQSQHSLSNLERFYSQADGRPSGVLPRERVIAAGGGQGPTRVHPPTLSTPSSAEDEKPLCFI